MAQGCARDSLRKCGEVVSFGPRSGQRRDTDRRDQRDIRAGANRRHSRSPHGHEYRFSHALTSQMRIESAFFVKANVPALRREGRRR